MPPMVIHKGEHVQMLEMCCLEHALLQLQKDILQNKNSMNMELGLLGGSKPTEC